MHKDWPDLYNKWLYSRWLEDSKTFIVACHRNSNNPRYSLLVERGETYLSCSRSSGGKRFIGYLTQIKCLQGSFGKDVHFLELFPDSFLLAPDDQPFLFHVTSRGAAENAIRNKSGLMLGFNRQGFFIGVELSRDAIHLLNEDPTRLKDAVLEAGSLGDLVHRLAALDGTDYDSSIPYLVHMDKYDTIISALTRKRESSRETIFMRIKNPQPF